MGEQSVLEQISTARVELARRLARSVVRVGGGEVVSRSGTWLDRSTIATIALEAAVGEAVAVQTAPGADPGEARVTAFDRRSGIALLELSGSAGLDVTVAADGPELGAETVTVAFPSPHGIEVRAGVIRCIGGEGDYLQTDSAAFPGFAGAPVFNAAGGLLGVTALGGGGNDSLVWTVARVRAVATADVPDGDDDARRAWLGVATQQVPLPEGVATDVGAGGALVTMVRAGSPAERGGLRFGDVVVGIAGAIVDGPHSLAHRLAESEPGATVTARVVRAGSVEEVELTLGAVPDDEEAGDDAAHHGHGRHHGGGHHHGHGHSHGHGGYGGHAGRWRRWAAATMMG